MTSSEARPGLAGGQQLLVWLWPLSNAQMIFHGSLGPVPCPLTLTQANPAVSEIPLSGS